MRRIKVEFDPQVAATAGVKAALERFQTDRTKFGQDGILPAKSALQPRFGGHEWSRVPLWRL